MLFSFVSGRSALPAREEDGSSFNTSGGVAARDVNLQNEQSILRKRALSPSSSPTKV